MPRLPVVVRSVPAVHGPAAAPARPMLGRMEGTAGEDDVPRSRPAMVATSGDG